MSNNILFIFEGERTEKQITDNLTNFFVNENTVVQCAYCNNIYQLYKDVLKDTDLDTFLLLKEIPANKDILSSFKSNDFAEIYLFFDYDGHDTLADDKKVEEVLTFFNEETSSGKLFLSYPMVEALKHITDNFKELKVEAKEATKYKAKVDKETDNKYKHFKKYNREIWIELFNLHLKKLHYITDKSFTLPTNVNSPKDIFLKQIENYIEVDSTVAVLSSFPVFILDYYGNDFIHKLLK